MPWAKERLIAWVESRPARSVFAEGGTAHPKTAQAAALMTWDANPATPARARVLAAVQIAQDVALLALLFASSAAIVSGGFNPFIYFQF